LNPQGANVATPASQIAASAVIPASQQFANVEILVKLKIINPFFSTSFFILLLKHF